MHFLTFSLPPFRARASWPPDRRSAGHRRSASRRRRRGGLPRPGPQRDRSSVPLPRSSEGVIGELGTALARMQPTDPDARSAGRERPVRLHRSPAEMCMAAHFDLSIGGRPTSQLILPALADGAHARGADDCGRQPHEPRQESSAEARAPPSRDPPRRRASSSRVSPPPRRRCSTCGWVRQLGPRSSRGTARSRSGRRVCWSPSAEIGSSGVHKACEITEEVT